MLSQHWFSHQNKNKAEGIVLWKGCPSKMMKATISNVTRPAKGLTSEGNLSQVPIARTNQWTHGVPKTGRIHFLLPQQLPE